MDSGEPTSRPQFCPDCGAAFSREGTYCWLCGWKLGDPFGVRPKQPGSPGVIPTASLAPTNTADPKWTFRLSTLFIWTAMVAVVMGVVRIAPGLGILLGIFSVPAALFTISVSAYRKRRSGRALTTGEKVGSFVGAFATVAGTFAIIMLIAIAVAIAAVFAFLESCMSALSKI